MIKKAYLLKIKESITLRLLIFFILSLISYKIYLWVDTEYTDNAYVTSDITTISPEVSGRIVSCFYKNNQFVNQGDVILEIDDEDYQYAYEKAIAALKIAENQLIITEQKLEVAKLNLDISSEKLSFANLSYDESLKDYNRISALTKDNFTSKKAFDSSKTDFEKAKLDLAEAKFQLFSSEQALSIAKMQESVDSSNIVVAKQNLAIAKKALSNTKVVAPISGVIANSYAHIGNFVSMQTPLLQIVPDKQIYINANFKETQVTRISVGSKVKIIFDSLSSYEIEGVVTNISPATGSVFSLIPPDNATGNFTKIVQRIPVRIDFTLPKEIEDIVKTGMSAKVYIRRSR